MRHPSFRRLSLSRSAAVFSYAPNLSVAPCNTFRRLCRRSWLDTSGADAQEKPAGRALKCRACNGKLILNALALQQHVASKRHLQKIKGGPGRWARHQPCLVFQSRMTHIGKDRLDRKHPCPLCLQAQGTSRQTPSALRTSSQMTRCGKSMSNTCVTNGNLQLLMFRYGL